VDPKTLEVQITPEDVLLTAAMEAGLRADDAASRPTYRPASVCRAIRLPAPIDLDRVKATYDNGQLRVTATIVGTAVPEQVVLGLPH
jgi:HSP20 family molecular chaperone IbpA